MSGEQNDVSDEGRIHVDEDWKKSVAEERERLRGEAGEAAETTPPSPEGGRLPEPSVQVFMAGLYTQTLIGLGDLENPISGKREFRPDEVSYLIDTIAMLRSKMEGNLSADETSYVDNLLYDLRMRYVAASDRAAGKAADSPASGEGDRPE
jgi:hypothetical protein